MWVMTALTWSGGYPEQYPSRDERCQFRYTGPECDGREDNPRRISPGTGNTNPSIVHSPLIPAFRPIGGLPPTSTILNTSTSSETNPERARARVSESRESCCNSRDICASRTVFEGTGVDEGDVGFD